MPGRPCLSSCPQQAAGKFREEIVPVDALTRDPSTGKLPPNPTPSPHQHSLSFAIDSVHMPAILQTGIAHVQGGEQSSEQPLPIPQTVPPTAASRRAGQARRVSVDADDGIRPDSTQEKLGALKPFFKKQGTVTAGNACQVGVLVARPACRAPCTVPRAC